MYPIRLSPEDLSGYPAKEPGLYHACCECTEEHRLRLAQRQGVAANSLTNNALC